MSERGRSLPWYGQIQCKDNPEAAAIWRSRHVEPDPCEPAWTADHYVTDMVLEAEREHGSGLWDVFARLYKGDDCNEATVIIHRYCLGETLDSTARFLGITAARVLQIERKALRRIRDAIRGTPVGDHPYWGRWQMPKAKHPGYAWEQRNV